MDQKHIAQAIDKAAAARAFGSDYIANILRQRSSPRSVEPPVQLKDPRLNELTTFSSPLLEYDALLLAKTRKRKRRNHDTLREITKNFVSLP